eukprot:7452531-Pyramimonas_sp.AAC.1
MFGSRGDSLGRRFTCLPLLNCASNERVLGELRTRKVSIKVTLGGKECHEFVSPKIASFQGHDREVVFTRLGGKIPAAKKSIDSAQMPRARLL